MLVFQDRKDLPPEVECEFDHGDVDYNTGRVFVAHTSAGTVEVFDGMDGRWLSHIPDCAGASGVIFDRVTGKVFAASRADGHILAIDPATLATLNKFKTGRKPNGLAADGGRKVLMTADVGDNTARFHGQENGKLIAMVKLRGRPRWCSYRKETDEYLINIMEPSGIEVVSPKSFKSTGFLDIGHKGPHGMALDGNVAFVACDDATLVALDLKSKKTLAEARLAGPPDVLWYNKKLNLVYCGIGVPGTVQAFDGTTLKMVQEVATEAECHTFAFDENLQRVYTFLPQSRSIGVYQA